MDSARSHDLFGGVKIYKLNKWHWRNEESQTIILQTKIDCFTYLVERNILGRFFFLINLNLI